VRIVVGVTDNRWAAFLRDRADVTEANFWQPSPHGFKALSPGEPFLFKTKDPKRFRNVDIPGYALVGGGFFDEYVELRVSEAWTIWGTANGVSDETELLARAQSYRSKTAGSTDPDPTIGCVILRNIFFSEPGAELPEPPNWARNNVTYTGYDLTQPDRRTDTDYVQHAFRGTPTSRSRRPGMGAGPTRHHPGVAGTALRPAGSRKTTDGPGPLQASGRCGLPTPVRRHSERDLS